MTQQTSLERLVADWMAGETAGGPPDQVVDHVLTSTGQVRPLPRWLAILREPPMTAQTRVLVGVPTRRLVMLAALLLLVALAALGAAAALLTRPPTPDTWAGFRGDPGRISLGVHGPTGRPTLAWQFDAGGPVVSNISVAGGLALVPSDTGTLHAVRIADGTAAWTFDGKPGMGGPFVVDGTVFIFDATGRLHALDLADGGERWTAISSVAGPTNPTRTGPNLIVGTEAGELIALDLASGDEAWRRTVAGGSPVHSPSAADGVVVALADDGVFGAFDAVDGELLWQLDVGDGRELGTPVVADGVAYLGASADSESTDLVAYDAATGVELWRTDEPFFSPSISDGVAYLGSSTGTVSALELANRREVWRVQLDGIVRPPAIAGGVVYLPADGERAVVAIDRQTGGELWRYDLGAANDCCIAVADGLVFVGTVAGTAVAIGGDGSSIVPGPLPGSTATPAAAATASGSPAPTATSIEPGPASPIDGTWTTAFSKEELVGSPLLLDRHEVNDQNWGDFTLTLARGEVTFSQRNEVDQYTTTGTFEVAGDRVMFSFSEGGNAGETFRFRWSMGDDALTFQRDPSMPESPTPFVLKPFVRSGATGAPETLPYKVEELSGTTFGWRLPGGIDIGPDGSLYVVSQETSEVIVVSPAGKVVRSWGSSGSGPGQFAFRADPDDPMSLKGSVAVAADGSVFVAEGGNRRVQVFTPAGKLVGGWGSLGAGDGEFLSPFDIEIGPDGTVYVVDDRRDDIQRFTSDGQFIQRFAGHGSGPGELSNTGGIGVGPDGTVYSADWGGDRVQAWTADGDLLWTIGDGGIPGATFESPIDAVVDAAGTLFVADGKHVQAFDTERRLTGEWVPARPDLGSMAVDGRTIYVSGPFDHAIWKLTPP